MPLLDAHDPGSEEAKQLRAALAALARDEGQLEALREALRRDRSGLVALDVGRACAPALRDDVDAARARLAADPPNPHIVSNLARVALDCQAH